MAKRKPPEQVIAESNAKIQAARLRIAREKSPRVRALEGAITALGCLPVPNESKTKQMLDAVDEALECWLEAEVTAANTPAPSAGEKP